MTSSILVGLLLASPGGAKSAIKFTGMYVEGCSCSAPCPCELVGAKMGCEGVGGFQVAKGTFAGKDIAGVKFAYATGLGAYVICYVDAPNKAKFDAAAALCKSAFTPFGKFEGVKAAKIALAGAAGKHTLTVNGGSTMKLTTEPVLGIDRKSPIAISNINSVLHSTVLQGKIVSCTFKEGEHSFELKGSNAYFNTGLKVDGSL